MGDDNDFKELNNKKDSTKKVFISIIAFSLTAFNPYKIDIVNSDMDTNLCIDHNIKTTIDKKHASLSIQDSLAKQINSFVSAPHLLKAYAGYGDPPKQSYFVPEVETKSSIDPGIYNERENITERRIKVEKEWKNMMQKVLKAIKKGNKADAQTILANNMTTLKNDMRLVAKVACGGDILERIDSADPKSEAKFDYNTGKFSYKPIAAKAETIFDQINDVYFNNLGTYVKSINIDETTTIMEQIDADFQGWIDMVK